MVLYHLVNFWKHILILIINEGEEAQTKKNLENLNDANNFEK